MCNFFNKARRFGKGSCFHLQEREAPQSGGTLRYFPRLKMEAEPVYEKSCFIKKIYDGRSPKEQIMSVSRMQSPQPYIVEIVYLYIYFMFYLRMLLAARNASRRVGVTFVNYNYKRIWRINYILITNLMPKLLFIHIILFSSTCFEP